jgi:hypothetical protein
MFASLGPARSVQSPSTSSENRRRCIADLGFACRAWLLLGPGFPPETRHPLDCCARRRARHRQAHTSGPGNCKRRPPKGLNSALCWGPSPFMTKGAAHTSPERAKVRSGSKTYMLALQAGRGKPLVHVSGRLCPRAFLRCSSRSSPIASWWARSRRRSASPEQSVHEMEP